MRILVAKEEAHRCLCLCTPGEGKGSGDPQAHAAVWGWQVRAAGLSWTISSVLPLFFSMDLEVTVPSFRCVHTQATAPDKHTGNLKLSK